MEGKDGNLIDFMTKKEDQKQEDAAMTDPIADGTCDPTPEKDNNTLLEEPEPYHTHGNNSSSSSDEEVEEGKDSKKRKKKGLKSKIKQKLSGEKENKCNKHCENSMKDCVQVENAEEKKGFLDKVKEKLAGHHTKTEGDVVSVPCANENSPGGEPKEKKGLMDKIIGSLPGHRNNGLDQKEKEN